MELRRNPPPILRVFASCKTALKVYTEMFEAYERTKLYIVDADTWAAFADFCVTYLGREAAKAEAKPSSRWVETTPLRTLTKMTVNEGGHDYGAMVVL